jgi:predicted nucleic acid-binding protein
MSAELFLDTNILVYAFDPASPAKQGAAQAVVRGPRPWTISWQVVQEFCHVARHRFARPMTADDLQDVLDLILLPHCRILPTAALYRQALALSQQSQYRYYDSLIVASALAGGCRELWSEDLQAGRNFGTLCIVNPFASLPAR